MLFSKTGYYVALFQKFVDTPINGHKSHFSIDSVHQMESSFPRFVGLLKLSMPKTNIASYFHCSLLRTNCFFLFQ
jgi:hypothetical protein